MILKRESFIAFLLLCVLLAAIPGGAQAFLPFGGYIVHSYLSACLLDLGIVVITIPVWLVSVGPPKPIINGMINPLVTAMVFVVGAAFGKTIIYPIVYMWYTFWKIGVHALGDYVPFPPNPILICPSGVLIMHIGTSLIR